MLQRCSLCTRGMTSFAKKVDIYLWQIATVISIRSMMTHINMSISGNDSRMVSHTCPPKDDYFKELNLYHLTVTLKLANMEMS